MAKRSARPKSPARRAGRPLDPLAGYRRIAAQLRERVTSGKFGHKQVLPGLRRLATELGVNANTVKSALKLLRAEGLIAPNAKRRLIVVPPESMVFTRPGYILEVISASLERVLVANYFADLQRGVECAAGFANAPMVIAHASRYSDMPAHEHFDLPLRGVVLLGRYKAEVLRVYERLPVPVVLADTPAPDFGGHVICVDNEAIAYAAAKRLVEKGHRRVAFFRYVNMRLKTVDPDARERQQGFLRALEEAGLRNGAGIYNLFRKDNAESTCFQEMFNARPPFTAVMTCEPSQADMTVAAARARGLTAPKDLEIVTFQALSDRTAYPGPRIDFFEMGRRAVMMLEKPRRPRISERVMAEFKA